MSDDSGSGKPYLRIAAEEAFAPADLIARFRKALTEKSVDDPGFLSLMGYFLFNDSPRTKDIAARLQDLDARRIGDMDASGIDKQLLSLTAPGVQIFDAATAAGLSVAYNDELADAVRRHPRRFAGLAAVAPQDPAHAAYELERGVRKLGLKGAIINSHTQGEYLDDAKFWPIFESAEALGVPVYIHPQTPPRSMIQPFLESGLEGAVYGFAVETGLHLLRLIMSGVFDRFPGLRIVVGHLGEGLPYWLFRVDFFHAGMVRTRRYENIRPLEKKPSDYMRENIYVTTSGMAWEPAIMYARSVLGADRVLYAMDYPYQYIREEVAVTDNLPITAEEKKALYQLNAERVFGLSE
ncbi:MAG TPA: amidohydrolase family protein [Gammaproteobacteria bacterium]|nr:amidohydrolase family protein [Gammaproteobacteria bacterium]